MATTFETAVEFVTVFVTAADEADAEEQMAPLWERGIDAEDGAEAYIDETCDVAIDD